MKARQPPKAEMSRAPCVAAASTKKPCAPRPSASASVPIESGGGIDATKRPKDRQAEMKRVCRNFSCDRREVESVLDKYKQKVKSLKDARERKDDQAVPGLKSAVESLEARLNESRASAKDTVHNGLDCLEKRELVQRSFSEARKMVEEERAPELQQYRDTLVQKYKIGRAEHDVPMQQAIGAIDNCKWVSEITWERP